jgi:heptose-I-phosphate ethanolaminephosphotransferase
MMTDALPHLLLYLAGIETPTYKEENNILSPKYNEMRPRILKNSADYDKLRDEYLKTQAKQEEKKQDKKKDKKQGKKQTKKGARK